MRNKSLFLHMGPGMSAEPEKAAFSAKLPHIYFWNQPPISTPDNSFHELVTRAKQQIELLSDHQNKINLIAHCFGSSIALECLRTHGDRINACQFIAPTFCMNEFLISLLRTLERHADTKASLKKKIAHFFATPYTPERFWEGHQIVIQDADFQRCYWANSSKRAEYQQHFAQSLTFHIETFKNVINQSINLQLSDNTPSFLGPVQFIVGSEDQILKNSDSLKKVHKQLKNSSIIQVAGAAHFPHFEAEFNFV